MRTFFEDFFNLFLKIELKKLCSYFLYVVFCYACVLRFALFVGDIPGRSDCRWHGMFVWKIVKIIFTFWWCTSSHCCIVQLQLSDLPHSSLSSPPSWSSSISQSWSLDWSMINITIMIIFIGLIIFVRIFHHPLDQHFISRHFYHKKTFTTKNFYHNKKYLPQKNFYHNNKRLPQKTSTTKNFYHRKLLPPAAENFQESFWARNQVKGRRNRWSVLKVRDPQLGREMIEDSKVLRGF